MKIRLKLTGTAPLLMHSIRLADPLDEYAKALKAVSKKRTKTEDDHREMARIEWHGSLYFDDTLGPYLPGFNIEKSIVEGARITKQGKQVERGLLILDDVCPLLYDGPRTLNELWLAGTTYQHRAAVGVSTSRVMRTRPVFKTWAVEADAELDPALVSLADIETIAEAAGTMSGIGDWRPRYGRFSVEVEPI